MSRLAGFGVGVTRFWMLGVAALPLGLGSSCGGSSDGGDGDTLTEACASVGNRLRECGLLSAGPQDCENSESVTGTSTAEVAETVCLASCFSTAECGALRAAVCEAVATSSTLYECFMDCGEQFGFQCADASGGVAGVPSSFACDGEEDCADGSDEQGCEMYICSSSQSVPGDYVCDGFPDCLDGRDELDEALGCPTVVCSDGATLPESYRCDGEADCADAGDEMDCPERAMLQCGG